MKFVKYLIVLAAPLLCNLAFGADCYYPGTKQNGVTILYLYVGDDPLVCPDIRIVDLTVTSGAQTACQSSNPCEFCVRDRYSLTGGIETTVFSQGCGTPQSRPGVARGGGVIANQGVQSLE